MLREEVEVHARALRTSRDRKEVSASRAGSVILPSPLPSKVESVHEIILIF